MDIMPTVCKTQAHFSSLEEGITGVFTHHMFFLALIGFLFYLFIESWNTRVLKRVSVRENRYERPTFWSSIIAYSLLNFVIAYTIGDISNSDIQPVFIYSAVMIAHLLISAHALREYHDFLFRQIGRWVLSFFLLFGWLVGYYFSISEVFLGMMISFIGGGIILNIVRDDIPNNRSVRFIAFFCGSMAYALLVFTQLI